MPIGFPPNQVFPLALDTDDTLFLVYNTSEAALAADNQAWADEIEIVPVADDQPEQWGENGFANIAGEMFYYDAVTKNLAGKIYKFNRCARNLGGTKTQFNKARTMVRGFVVAEHHNQLVDTTIAVERYIRPLVLDLEEIQDVPVCVDDFDCPDVNFDVQIDPAASSDCNGIVIQYSVSITGEFTSFSIDFGDGHTTTDKSGTHTYAANATVDPIVSVGNNKCEMIQTPSIRSKDAEPTTTVPVPFEIEIPEVPEFPPVIMPVLNIPSTNLILPPIVFPCIDINIPSFNINIPSINIQIPSMISFGPVNIPSMISFGPVNIPTMISFGPISTFPVISFGPPPGFPVISFGPVNIPLMISFGPVDIPTMISFGPLPPFPMISFGPLPPFPVISFGPLPPFPVISFGPTGLSSISLLQPLWGISLLQPLWGISLLAPPTISVSVLPISVVVVVSCPTTTPLYAMNKDAATFIDSLNEEPMQVESVGGFGIPSEIKIIAPIFPDVKLIHNIPNKISLEVPEFKNISIIGPEIPIPQRIEIAGVDIPKSISVTSDIPRIIQLDASNLPMAIRLEMPDVMPMIKLDVSDLPKTIKVEGIPETIELKGNIPSEIFIRVPENLEVPLVYKGGPIPIKFDATALTNPDGDEMPCFAIVPCGSKK